MSCQNPGIFRDYTVKQGINFIEIDLHAGDEIPDWEVQNTVWSVEDSREWKTEDTDKFFYNIEETKND